MKISEIPKGTRIYIDANIFIYHFGSSSFSDESTSLLTMAQKGEINGVCSIATIIEVNHRLMILEAVEKYNFQPKDAIKKLKEKPELVKDLNKHSECVNKIFQIGLDIFPVCAENMLEASVARKEFGLLTNDSIIVTIMNSYGISNIATNDSDFERIQYLKIWKP